MPLRQLRDDLLLVFKLALECATALDGIVDGERDGCKAHQEAHDEEDDADRKISHPGYVFETDDLNLCHDTHAAGKDANYCTAEEREEGNEVPWDLIDLGKAFVAGEVTRPCLHRERDNASNENGQYEQQVDGDELLAKLEKMGAKYETTERTRISPPLIARFHSA